MAPSRTTAEASTDSITLNKTEAAAIREVLLRCGEFKPNWTQVGTAIGLKAPRNGGRAFKDAIAKLGLELNEGAFSKIANNDATVEDEDVKESKGVKGKKRKGDAGEEAADSKKTKMEKGGDDDDAATT